ncbi:heat shock protein GrpE [Aquipluma nitroreducens]|uniref:Protein GrpE n=1 Tax=Aquipluma nitroreducens TaxID=2010828 RepID=A0A5K7S6C4_9BACT|nr:nucleotide exchange factor GrpE [Aquipluma nitroreducens]BBE17047.1 heat shock protein GrpE [Aquipluma nitroreducens]
MTTDKEKANEELEIEAPDSMEQQEGQTKKETKKDKTHKKNKVEEQLEKAEAELLELKDKHIRLQAEFDNYRKRTLKERMELLKTASESVLVGILPVIDDFDRAIQTLDQAEENSHLKDGVMLIFNKFQDFLKQNGVKEIEGKDQAFDTDLHEAITTFPAPSEELKGKIIDVVQKGYYLNDKVIRHSKVVIGE